MVRSVHPLRTQPLLLLAVALGVIIGIWAISAQATTERPNNDPLDVLAGRPDPSESRLEDQLDWALRLLDGESADTEAADRLSPWFLSQISIAEFRIEGDRLATMGPWKFFGFDADESVNLASAMVQAADGTVHGLTVAADPLSPDRLTLLGVSPVEVESGPYSSGDFPLHLSAALALLACGLFAASAGRNRAAWLLVAAGWLWQLQLLELAEASVLYTVGLIAGPVAAALVGWTLIAGLPEERWSGATRLVGGLVAVAGLVALSPLLVIDTGAISLPDNLVSAGHSETWGRRLITISSWTTSVAVAAVILTVIGRQLKASVARRRRLIPQTMGGLGAASLAAIPALSAIDGSGAVDLSQSSVVSAAAIVAALGLAVSLFLSATSDMGAVATLLGERAEGETRLEPGTGDPLQAMLRQALSDPTARLLRWHPDTNTYVDDSGQPMPVSATDVDITLLDASDQPLGAVHHGVAANQRDASVVDTACGAVRLVLENESLQAELELQLDEVRSSRARIVEAGEAARREVERDLHDGAQQRLLAVLLSVQAGRARFGAEDGALDAYLSKVANDLGLAITQLRELSRGLHPAILEHGLSAAVESLAETSAIPATVHVAGDRRFAHGLEHAGYFVVSEGLANAARHSEATHVVITISASHDSLEVSVADDGRGGAQTTSGHGLQNLDDRVTAFGGTLTIASPPGNGTTLKAILPCD